MKDEDEKTYVVEVNGNPGTKIINITNYNYFNDLIKLIEHKTRKFEMREQANHNKTTNNETVSIIEKEVLPSKTNSNIHPQQNYNKKIEEIKRLKAKYPGLMKDITI